ncbi:hypothetical protein KSC_007510 [Ktedonobacter sp. SOSP1-52]|uniref:hypothetical protein n=1 Tax=Ktedonobacter sp. SOSP1-52 TaxID=2778366 RepID=UPI0019154621|nr:hypothetical protein [Ktedonobacter sp. SOSP1-52]GHO61859.1 hypothetical protein KSC_007510 [Ktedonobacter sp. SOSP1-52]
MPATLSIQSAILAVVMVIACLTCIWMVFFFGRRLQTSAYMRTFLLDSVKRQEMQSLLRQLHDRAATGPLDPNFPPPPKFGNIGQLWEDGKWVSYEDRFGDQRASLTKEDEDEEKKRLDILGRCRTWEQEERKRYADLSKQAEAEALKRAEQIVPQAMDISLLGGGWTFLLEFSTVIVIIFTLLILGVLGSLEGKEISTILAAIAGYVLGRTTTATTQNKKEGPEA